MNISADKPPKAKPVTISLPEDLLRRVRVLCASRDETLGSFFTTIAEQAVATLPNELADLVGVPAPTTEREAA